MALRDENKSYRHEGAQRVWLEDDRSLFAVRTINPAEGERLLTDAWGVEAAPAAEILEMKRLGGVLWLRVKVLVGEACEVAFEVAPKTLLGEGWLPAHDRFGRPVVWFETYCD